MAKLFRKLLFTDTNARVFRPGEVQWHAKEHRTDKLSQFKKQLILK